MEQLRTIGFNVVIGTLRQPGPLQELARSYGWSTFHLGARSAGTYLKAAMKLRMVIREHDVDIIHANESIQGAIGSVSSRLARVPCLFHRHHTSATGARQKLTKLAGRSSALTLAVSHAVAAAAIADGVPKERVAVSHNGLPALPPVTADDAARLRDELGLPPDLPVITVVGHLRPEKGHATLLRAAQHATELLRTPVGVVVVGDGPLRGDLEGLARSMETVHTTFAGHRADIERYLAVGQVAAVPSYSEAFGLVAIEAMSCAKPVVASDVDGLREIVEHGRTGLLVAPADHETLGSALARCLTDPKQSTALGEAGRVRYESMFTVSAMVDGWARAYGKAMSSSR